MNEAEVSIYNALPIPRLFFYSMDPLTHISFSLPGARSNTYQMAIKTTITTTTHYNHINGAPL